MRDEGADHDDHFRLPETAATSTISYLARGEWTRTQLLPISYVYFVLTHKARLTPQPALGSNCIFATVISQPVWGQGLHAYVPLQPGRSRTLYRYQSNSVLKYSMRCSTKFQIFTAHELNSFKPLVFTVSSLSVSTVALEFSGDILLSLMPVMPTRDDLRG